jgi:hypothetical protein
MPLLVLCNPVCGDGSAKAFFETEVLPMLANYGRRVDKFASTEYAGHAGTIVVDFLRSSPEDVTIVLGSGDGTLHEIINRIWNIQETRVGSDLSRAVMHLALVPCGTGNALYSSIFPCSDPILVKETAYRLQSLQSLIDGSSSIPLTLAITNLLPPPGAQTSSRSIVSAVVVSTAFHAAIVHDSETLRQEMPGLERFQAAAHRNVFRWYSGSVQLFPAESTRAVHIYDPSLGDLTTHGESGQTVNLQGPFIYFLSAGDSRCPV